MTLPVHPRGASRPARLARLGFEDVAVVEPALVGLGFFEGEDREDEQGAGLDAALLELSSVADPRLAALTLARMAQGEPVAGPRGQGLLAQLAAEPDARRRLFAVLGASAALGEFLVAHPGSWRTLGRPAETRPGPGQLRADLLRAVRADPDLPAPRAGGSAAQLLDPLRVAYRRGQLQVAARDLTGMAEVEEVTAELADLAAAALEAGLAVARAELAPHAQPAALAVVAMGKCGARELNYVSDVDVVFVGGDQPDGLPAATRLAEGLMRACGEVTADGQLFPVDAGLRPEGRDGPLVRTLASHLAYYQRWARTWEFQALLKARPVAGDLQLGTRYRDSIAPMVWQASARPHFVEDVQAMRRRVEQSVPRREADRQLKLGPGGLRDVEFAVQLLQLVHGRADESLRVADTLSALAALSEGGYVGREDAEALSEAYRWLRRAEHRLQLQRLRRTHTLPAEDGPRRWLARSMGYPDLAAFDADHERRSVQVRQLHEKLFYRPLLTATARLPTEEMRLTPAAAEGRLAALGFHDTATALRHIEALTTGLSRRAAIQRTLLPVLLGDFAASPDPDAGLLAFRQVSDALGDTSWYLRLLRDTGVTAERLARVLASSRYATDLLGRAPEAMALLGDDAELLPRPRAELAVGLTAITSRSQDWEATVAVARSLRRHELVRVACADVLGRLDVHAVGQALTDITAVALGAALEIALDKVQAERRSALPMTLAVIALGRFGGEELGYASDADVLFVHDPLPGVRDEEAAAVAHDVAEELRRLLALPAPDPPLVVDAGLRPEGRQGPLVRSLSSYAAYYERWSRPWEAQALLRAAPCAGDSELAERFVALADSVRYPDWVTGTARGDTLVEEIRRLKQRMEQERVAAGTRTRDLKLGIGGLSDVEWTAQLLQLRHAHEVAPLRVTGTVATLRAAVTAGVLDAEDADVLVRAWALAAAARNAVTHVTGRPGDLLPRSGRALEGVARLLGYPPGGSAAFSEEHRRLARRARAVVERVFYGGQAAA